MKFYSNISEYYHHIFPLNKAQLNFVNQSFFSTTQLNLLDIGCGIGELSFELSKHFKKVNAIDLDERMINRAKQDFDEKASNLQFHELNMLEIENHFGNNSFDIIICFGNTLVHLKDSEQILDFFKQAKKVLKDQGKLLFQIINYDRIIDQNIKALPTIENDNIQFVRNYELLPIQKKIDFKTKLTIKETGQVLNNMIQLNPIRKKEVDRLLKKAGFKEIKYYSNFKKVNYMPESIPLVVEAK